MLLVCATRARYVCMCKRTVHPFHVADAHRKRRAKNVEKKEKNIITTVAMPGFCDLKADLFSDLFFLPACSLETKVHVTRASVQILPRRTPYCIFGKSKEIFTNFCVFFSPLSSAEKITK